MIRLKDVEMEYDNGTKAIKGITLTIEDGEFVFWWVPPAPASPRLSSF